MSHYPSIVLEGTPHQRGIHYGQAASDQIRNSIALYRDLFQTHASLSWNEATETALSFEQSIKDYWPDALEEIAGIAEGAGVSYGDILALNCRSEIMFARPEGCTSIIIPPAAANDCKPYLAQTWDWLRPSHHSIVLLEIRQHPLPTILMICEAGLIGGKGINSAGIGCGLNALGVRHGRIGTPLHILYRGIMNSVKISDAIKAVSQPARAGSGNFIIGSADGFVLYLEFTPDNFDLRMADNQALAHTNHYLSPLLAPEDCLKSSLTSTFPRLAKATSLLNAKQGNLDKAYIQNLLADHTNYPDSICSHEDAHSDPLTQMCTIYSVFIDLQSRALWVAPGNPCQGKWRQYRLMPGT